MGDKVSIDLENREVFGKKVAKLRREGLTPVVIYGAEMEPVAAQVATTDATKTFRTAGYHTPVHVSVAGKKKIAMIKDVDVDPVRQEIRHIAFHAVKQNQPVEAEVAVRLIGEGESEAEKAGLVVLQALDRVQVKALPMDLPEAIEVNISGLKEAGDRVTLADAVLPSGVEYVEHDDGRRDEEDDEEAEKPKFTDQMVASVWEPAALEAANAAAAGTAENESEVEAENGDEETSTESDTTDATSE